MVNTLPHPDRHASLPTSLLLRHWEMLYHLSYEISDSRYPYETHMAQRGLGANGFLEVLEFAKWDPRFRQAGLIWHQNGCFWEYRGQAPALALFLGEDPADSNTCDKVLRAGKSGLWRTQLEGWIRLRRKYARLPYLTKEWQPPKRYDFMKPELYAQKSVVTEENPFGPED